MRQPDRPCIHVSRAGDFGSVRLDAPTAARLTRWWWRATSARRWKRLDELPRLTLPARAFRGFGDAAEGVRVLRIADDAGERNLRVRLVVGADGTRSQVREALGIGANHDYGQRLFVTRLRTQRAPGPRTSACATTAPALLPRGDGHYGLVPRRRGRRRCRGRAGDAAFLDRAAGFRLARGTLRVDRPAQLYRWRRWWPTPPRARCWSAMPPDPHPLGAQGSTSACAMRSAGRLVAGGDNPGDAALLRTYVERRREDRERTLQFSDRLARFLNPAPWLRPLRSLGLLAVDGVPSLQSLLAGGAMGYRGDVPELCRSRA